MLTLGIDSSTDIGSIGLIDDQKFLGEVNIRLHHRHSERLLINIDHLIQEAGYKVKDLELVAVTVGPGSFTGLRIGITTMKTIAQSLEIPIIGLSTLDVLAYNIYANQGWLLPIIDAGRKRVYTALYPGGYEDIRQKKKWEDQVISLKELFRKLEDIHNQYGGFIHLVGNGIQPYNQEFKNSKLAFTKNCSSFNIPRGGIVADLGQYYFEKGESDDLVELVPNYLKKPQAEIDG